MASEKELLSKLIERWQGACRDASGKPEYQVKDGRFLFTVPPSLVNLTEVLTRLSGVPSNAEQQGNTWTWESVADTVFVNKLPRRIHGYELRQPQLWMARMIQRAREMGKHAVIEAATGTGKSYAYLYPAMEMGLRILVSTSNKALQQQLVKKDIPTVLSSYPGKKFCLVQGKSNYACLHKVAKVQLHGQLKTWLEETKTGNTEDIDFSINYDDLDRITADDGCSGYRCNLYSKCFYYQAKAEREEADILICNHALLAIHLDNPEAGILPGEFDLIIVDEAHKLADYIRSAHTSEIKLSTVQHHIDSVKRASLPVIELMQAAETFCTDMEAKARIANPLTVDPGAKYEAGLTLSKLFFDAAHIIFAEGDVPMSDEGRQAKRKATELRKFSARLHAVSNPTPKGYARWIETRNDAVIICAAPWDIAAIMAKYLHPEQPACYSRSFCAGCGDDLGDYVSVLNERGYCGRCIEDCDPLGEAEYMPFAEYAAIVVAVKPKAEAGITPFIFTSATLATPNMDGFCRSLGIRDALHMIAPSPFDYEKNSILFVPNGEAPSPKDDANFGKYVIDEMRRLALAAKGGTFLLFTSYKNMTMVHGAIKTALENAGLTVLIQGKNTKQQIVAEFKQHGNCVLFATKSFWEGIDIQGDNLRQIVIDKLPMPTPHPLLQAAKDAGAGDWYTIDLPLAITDLKQGVGRLIRTNTDKGVMAILDTRIRTMPYGRNSVLPSLPPAPLTHDFWQVSEFLRNMQDDRKLSPLEIFGVEREFVQPIEIDGVIF